MNELPMIGITADQENSFDLSRARTGQNLTYVRAILRAGGIPVLMPVGTQDVQPALLDRLDGVLFTGGLDINPTCYGGDMHPAVPEVDPLRDATEIPLVRLVIERGMPFLGICRGIQMLNVSLGGTLFQDIASQRPNSLHHPCYPKLPRDLEAHKVEIVPDSLLAKSLGCTLTAVNSLHHQAIRELAPRLKPVAFAPDGIIEGVELPDYAFGIGVQWHPEAMPESTQMQSLFKAFLGAVSLYSKKA
jgi:putative glutamine amidotransferase